MIGFLKGNLVHKAPPQLVVDVQGVGYEVEAPMSTFYQLEQSDGPVTILTHMHVREDAMLLFGFASEPERILFKTLIKVNGVGAKMALAVLSAMSVDEFCRSVESADVVALTRIPGVGKKTAERLQIEMRDRLKDVFATGLLTAPEAVLGQTGTQAAVPLGSVQLSAVDALVALGYKTPQAEKMVEGAYEEGLSLEALIKRALQGVSV